MSEHTPGPWGVLSKDRVFPSAYDGMEIITVVTGPGDGDIAVIPDDYPTGAWANAVLIAAAPEMLEALEEALDLLMPHYDSDGFFHLTADGIEIDEGCEHCQLWARLSPLIHRLKGGAS